MFTGIITDIGKILEKEKRGEDIRLTIATLYDMNCIDIGASVACDGVCLTVVEKRQGSFTVDVSAQTLICTCINAWEVGRCVNLERALKIGDELGGHIVSGHIDDFGKMVSIKSVSGCYVLHFSMPEPLKALIAVKGSITINGVSLTVNQVDDICFSVNIIPHTWQHTGFQYLEIDDKVHLEVDMLAPFPGEREIKFPASEFNLFISIMRPIEF